MFPSSVCVVTAHFPRTSWNHWPLSIILPGSTVSQLVYYNTFWDHGKHTHFNNCSSFLKIWYCSVFLTYTYHSSINAIWILISLLSKLRAVDPRLWQQGYSCVVSGMITWQTYNPNLDQFEPQVTQETQKLLISSEILKT